VSHTITHTDAASGAWFHDDVSQLREWNSNRTHPLPPVPIRELTIGAASTCSIQLADDSGLVSRLHARLKLDRGRWQLEDLQSKNGILVEGELHQEVPLRPGLEVRIGGITLMAESPGTIELRNFLCRFLGWARSTQKEVNLALRSLRMANAGNAPLMLCGDDDLSGVARGLHDRAPRKTGPFVLCDPERQRAPASVRLAANEPTATAAIAAAEGGTICVHSHRLPKDFSVLMKTLRTPPYRVQAIFCAAGVEEARGFTATPLVIPPLRLRTTELDRIIDEYAADAIAMTQGAETFAAEDRAWVAEHSAESIPEIEKGTSRLVALRTAGSVLGAANLLGMHHTSLRRWIERRKPPMQVATLGYRISKGGKK
jgi:FHA domain